MELLIHLISGAVGGNLAAGLSRRAAPGFLLASAGGIAGGGLAGRGLGMLGIDPAPGPAGLAVQAGVAVAGGAIVVAALGRLVARSRG
ncbi:hypothetical protein [Roseovarius salinarum]|uniref:hypothetical protein n=1 Tax=Roseovarius salinarum TaxID=1981892 RepID=UPI000C338ABE|nr:hypothetical protein [Roseovarius salinarum]